MSTVQLEVLRREAAEEEREEIKLIREKYKDRKKQLQQQKDSYNLDQERDALIQQAEQQEQQEKEQIKQKYKQRLKTGQLNTNPTTNQEIQALIQEAEQQEQQEKEQIKQKYKQRLKTGQLNTNPTTNQEIQALIQDAEQQEQQEKEQIKQKYRERLNQLQQNPASDFSNLKIEGPQYEVVMEEFIEIGDAGEVFEEEEIDKEAENANYLSNAHFDDEIYNKVFGSENVEINEFNEENETFEAFEETELIDETKITQETELTVETEETVDRSAILAKYNIKDVQDDDIDRILENFDKPKIEENIDKIEERIVSNIKKTALSHPKIKWVNVLVFLDEDELEGSIKIFAEFNDGNLLKRIMSEDNGKLEVELIQMALYEVWDVFTTLGVNIDDLESKIDVGVELERA